jgi:hypothetical protein
MYLMVVHCIVWFEKNMVELPIWPIYLQHAWQYVLESYSSIENSKMNYQIKLLVDVGEKRGLVVRAEDSHPRGCGFEFRRILDGCKRY